MFLRAYPGIHNYLNHVLFRPQSTSLTSLYTDMRRDILPFLIQVYKDEIIGIYGRYTHGYIKFVDLKRKHKTVRSELITFHVTFLKRYERMISNRDPFLEILKEHLQSFDKHIENIRNKESKELQENIQKYGKRYLFLFAPTPKEMGEKSKNRISSLHLSALIEYLSTFIVNDYWRNADLTKITKEDWGVIKKRYPLFKELLQHREKPMKRRHFDYAYHYNNNKKQQILDLRNMLRNHNRIVKNVVILP